MTSHGHPASTALHGKAERYGPWALITGASDGIGREFANALARQGMHLVLVARRETVLAGLAEQFTLDYGVACRVIALDLGRADAAKTLDDSTHDSIFRACPALHTTRRPSAISSRWPKASPRNSPRKGSTYSPPHPAPHTPASHRAQAYRWAKRSRQRRWLRRRSPRWGVAPQCTRGWLSKLLGWSLATLPRWGRTRVFALIMRGMIKPG